MHKDFRKLREQAKPFIRFEKDVASRIATITLDRPERQNAVTAGMRQLFTDMVHRANIDDEIKVLVVRAEGENFGTGGDLQEEKEMLADPGAPLGHEMAVDFAEVRYPAATSYRYFATLYAHWAGTGSGTARPFQNFKKISIVEVQGYCYGWHFFLTADADLVVASEDALFAHPSFRWAGWAPRMWTWCETMGFRSFAEMLLTGRPFTAREMDRAGFLNSVVPREQLREETAKYAAACSRSRPTDTVVAQKTFFEIYKQYRGEYFGSLLTAFFESSLPMMADDGRAGLGMDEDSFGKGMNNAIKDNDLLYPPDWRYSRTGRNRT